ncbi:hypothetical protein PR002_g20227 [Phytophthora rubi]|uniref:Uncharacterized protein n=1 Tax=Phytophthora rubi TaxID=129364 RepID=A0A6A3JIW7_9STRA|nr:hypothetical protein PR002_g20227 [Phytophthora rubi]
MELGVWRAAVPYGAYMQPIHLKIGASDVLHTSPSTAQEPPSESVENAPQTNTKDPEDSANGTPNIPSLPEPSTERKTAPTPAQSTAETVGVTVIPPFTSECLDGDQKMALNVGGPVWAMDWLPSKPAANAAAVAAALIKTKQKKPRRGSAAAKAAAKAAARGKENNKVESSGDADGETTAASNGSAEPGQDATQQWRFLALATHPPCQVEDGKVVKATPPDHYYDVPESARSLIQIWAVPVNRPKVVGTGRLRNGKAGKTTTVKPRVVYAIDHESGVAWDLQWCPLVKKFPKAGRREKIMGILAACFGDGSMRVFEIPEVPGGRLQQDISKEGVVETNAPVVVARLPRILQLSVQWSPHNWNMLLTGGSDGSVSLWNIKSAISESDSSGAETNEPEPIEPQRRFQDADTVGKQEAFDWGCGWVAIRAVAWSPFDEHLFATTGNDSVFKVWDVREPRVCLRSHRIRSTWGLALQWMDQTSIQISGDQGSVYMYDILSGSYQKLHFHPQIDSPVWDLQFARRGAVPLLISSCTSGSIRAAPAKKLYRAPQNCVEICRLSGEKDSSVEKPFKSLTVSFDKHSVLGSADSGILNTREFCERDAALHRLRLSSSTAGDYPCYLAAGGHAGLVILLEMQEVLDTLIATFFLPPSKKIGRPKKAFASAVGGLRELDKEPSRQTGASPAAATNMVPKARTIGSFAKAKGMHTALSKYKKKSLGKGKGKAAKQQKKSFIQEDGEVELEDNVEEEEEPEFEEEDDEEEESDLSLVMGESSDDDRVSVSDVEVEEESTPTEENPEEARLMKEYQLDLSEEDAILLAIQMSEFDAAPKTENNASEPANGMKESQAKDAGAGPRQGKKRARPSSTASDIPPDLGVTVAGESIGTSAVGEEHTDDTECKAPVPAPTTESAKPATPVTTMPPPTKAKPKEPKKAPTRKATAKTKRESPVLLEAIQQAMALQAFEYQLGMSEEDALKEAIRLSELADNSRDPEHSKQPDSHSPSDPVNAAAPTPTQPKQTPATPRAKGSSQKKKQNKVKEPTDMSNSDAASAEEELQRQRPQTPRRLEFSPLNGSEGGDQAGVPPANIDGNTHATAEAAAPEVTASTASAVGPSQKKPAANGAAKSMTGEQKQPAKATRPAMKTPKKKPAEMKPPASAGAAVSSTPEGKTPAKRSRSTGAKAAAPPAKKRKQSTAIPRGGRRNSSNSSSAAQGDVMSEEDALLLALRMSEIEY